MNDWDPRKTSDNRHEWTVEGRDRPGRDVEIEVEVETDDGCRQYVWLDREDLQRMLLALDGK